LKDEVGKVKQLVIQFFPVFVKGGLCCDNRITNAYGKLLTLQLGRHTNDEHNQHLISVRKWVSQRFETF